MGDSGYGVLECRIPNVFACSDKCILLCNPVINVCVTETNVSSNTFHSDVPISLKTVPVTALCVDFTTRRGLQSLLRKHLLGVRKRGRWGSARPACPAYRLVRGRSRCWRWRRLGRNQCRGVLLRCVAGMARR